VKAYPIIFSAPMVRALLAGRKTMTRRLAWAVARVNPGGVIRDGAGGQMDYVEPHEELRPTQWQSVKVGDRLWVRETWQGANCRGEPQLTYRATPDHFPIDAWDGPDEGAGPSFNYDRCPGTNFIHPIFDVIADDGPWRSPIHMPRWASRLTLEIRATKVERLQDISVDDIRREGLVAATRSKEGIGADEDLISQWIELWDDLHGPLAWDANPEVAVLIFTVHQANIDAMKVAA
jgi:hypothetical protein